MLIPLHLDNKTPSGGSEVVHPTLQIEAWKRSLSSKTLNWIECMSVFAICLLSNPQWNSSFPTDWDYGVVRGILC